MSGAPSNRERRPLKIGVDLDNTIVCYDRLFQQLAIRQGLVPGTAPASKRWVREHLRSGGREDTWTMLQGEAYGPMMRDAEIFPGAKSFFAACIAEGYSVYIVSHRTRHPYLGPRYDLHESALAWLEEQDFVGRSGLPRETVFLESSRPEKLARIAKLGCTHFIDDLIDFLNEPEFCRETERVLFDPQGEHLDAGGVRRADSWQAVGQLFGLAISSAPPTP